MVVGIHPDHLRKYVIEPVLDHLARWEPRIKSEAAIRLLLMTAAHESKMGRFLHQQGGPALGVYQMEPATHDDLWEWIMQRGGLADLIRRHEASEMEGSLYYATAMARLYYWRDREPLPAEDDLEGLAGYAKRVWNTSAGKATVADYATAARLFEIA